MTPFWIFFTLWLLAAPIHGTMAAEKNVDAAKLLALTQAPPSGSRLTLPPGTYRLCDQPGKGLLFRGWENKEIVAEGVTLILKPGQSFTLENCRNIRVRGLTIDCDPLPWSEATLTAPLPAPVSSLSGIFLVNQTSGSSPILGCGKDKHPQVIRRQGHL